MKRSQMSLKGVHCCLVCLPGALPVTWRRPHRYRIQCLASLQSAVRLPLPETSVSCPFASHNKTNPWQLLCRAGTFLFFFFLSLGVSWYTGQIIERGRKHQAEGLRFVTLDNVEELVKSRKRWCQNCYFLSKTD